MCKYNAAKKTPLAAPRSKVVGVKITQEEINKKKLAAQKARKRRARK